MLGTNAIILLVLLAVTCAIVCLVMMLLSSAIIFSRVTFALLGALVACQQSVTLVESSGFLNFVAWSAVILGVVFLLSNLPRVDVALKFFCTILISTIIVTFVMSLIGGLANMKNADGYQMTTTQEIVMKIICAAFAVGGMILQNKKAVYDQPANPVMNQLERLLAAATYGVAISFLSISVMGNWEVGVAAQLLILAGGTAVAFAADIFLAGKDIFGLMPEKEVVVPR